MRLKLEPIFRETMERKGVLPVRPNNKRTLRWLEKRGCITRFDIHGRPYFHPEPTTELFTKFERPLAPFEIRDIRDVMRMRDAFRIHGDKDDGSRNFQMFPALSWLGEGTMIEIELRREKSFIGRKAVLTVWVPKELVDRILVLQCFP